MFIHNKIATVKLISNFNLESITSYGTRWGRDDLGYGSAVSSGAPSPNNQGSFCESFVN